MKRAILASLAIVFALPLAAASAQASTSMASAFRGDAGGSPDAGYVVGATSVKQVSADWRQPSATCTSTDTFARFWVGLGDDRKQVSVRAGVEADCKAGQPVYTGWVQFSGSPRQHFGKKIAAGDLMGLSLATNSKGLTGQIVDKTAGWGEAVISGMKIQPDAAAILVSERRTGSGVRPLTDFGTIDFTHVQVNRSPIGGQDFARLHMQTRSGIVKAKASKLAANGDFAVTWLHQ